MKNMKFWSLSHGYFILMAIVIASQLKTEYGPYLIVFMIIYGLFMINWRVHQLQSKEAK